MRASKVQRNPRGRRAGVLCRKGKERYPSTCMAGFWCSSPPSVNDSWQALKNSRGSLQRPAEPSRYNPCAGGMAESGLRRRS